LKPVTGEIPLSPKWATWWFRVSGTIPKTWRKKNVDFIFRTYCECLVWQNGSPVGGLNYDSLTPFKDGGRISIRLKNVSLSGKFELYVEVAANGLFGEHPEFGNSGANQAYRFDKAALALVNEEAWELYHDLWLASTYLQHKDDVQAHERTVDKLRLDPWRGYLCENLNSICNVVVPEKPSTWKLAKPFLKNIYQHKNATFGAEVSAIGHAHIDTAWLWPLAESIRKCARTFSTALAYMEDYPDYRFSCSQAHQYQWMKDYYPELYSRIKVAVKRGQWIPVGGSWIEPDCVIPSGESFVRQFLYGKQFFKKEFGIDIKEFWNPDVFGYSGQLPQIIRGVGMDFFLTQKLSWNQFNQPTHQNFYWEGIDGTKVLTHFPPADTYNAMTDGRVISDVIAHSTKAKDNERTNQGLLLFGYGDGGGGPTRHMLEILKRIKDFQGIPKTKQTTAQEFFKKLENNIADVPTIKGELYLEYHRACYTTQAANKQGNRKSETALRAVEILASISSLPYPKEELERLWKIVLLNQFHDILPGSSIREVYEVSARDYADVLKNAQTLEDAFVSSFVKPDPHQQSAVNLCSWERKGFVELSNPGKNRRQTWNGKYLCPVTAPSMGIAHVNETTQLLPSVKIHQAQDHFILENDLIKATFLKTGHLVSLIEKQSHREYISKGKAANQFVLFDDRPVAHDAWDVEIYHLETRQTLPPAKNAKLIEEGPYRVGIEFLFKFGSSRLTQRVFLENHCGHLEFDCDLDWHERHQFLKVAFPVEIHSPEATYEIQFGNVKRATHFNTAYDVARFELNAHKWIDLSETGCGVSLFTDNKYGYSVHGNVMRISLVRGPTAPDEEADQGKHSFRFACFPHSGTYIEAQTLRHAHEFNQPWIIVNGKSKQKCYFSLDNPNLVIDTIKKSESGNALIVRLYECHGSRGTATLNFPEGYGKVDLVNLMEEEIKSLKPNGQSVKFSFKPFAILTFKIELD
jgi:alpha-mannosidase